MPSPAIWSKPASWLEGKSPTLKKEDSPATSPSHPTRIVLAIRRLVIWWWDQTRLSNVLFPLNKVEKAKWKVTLIITYLFCEGENEKKKQPGTDINIHFWSQLLRREWVTWVPGKELEATWTR